MARKPYQPEDYEEAIYAWLRLAVPSVEVIYSKDRGPRPKKLYVALSVTAFVGIGEPDNVVLDEAFGDEFRGSQAHQYEGTVTINAIGLTARNVIEVIKRSRRLPAIVALNTLSGLSLLRAEGTVDLTELQGTQYEPRFEADIFFGWASSTVYEAKVIESATATEI